MPELCVVVLEAQAEAKTATAASARSVDSVFISRGDRFLVQFWTCQSCKYFKAWEKEKSQRSDGSAGSLFPEFKG